MLPKGARLTSSDVQAVLARGLSISIPAQKGKKTLISGKFLAAPGPFRVAAVASKSLAKRAVDRNKIRRAVYRAVAHLPTPKKGGLAVIFVRNIPEGALTPAFESEISIFFQKISS